MTKAVLLVVAVALLAGCEDDVDDGCRDGVHDEVTRVVDGDTLDGAVCGRIRLALVDTPETNEPGFGEAAAFTESLCPVDALMEVDIDAGQPWDTTGTRRVALVRCGGENLNARLLEEGLADVLTEFCAVSEFAQDDWARDECS